MVATEIKRNLIERTEYINTYLNKTFRTSLSEITPVVLVVTSGDEKEVWPTRIVRTKNSRETHVIALGDNPRSGIRFKKTVFKDWNISILRENKQFRDLQVWELAGKRDVAHLNSQGKSENDNPTPAVEFGVKDKMGGKSYKIELFDFTDESNDKLGKILAANFLAISVEVYSIKPGKVAEK